MNIAFIEKSSKRLKLSIYNESLALIESNWFSDSNTLNFYLQTLARKRRIENGLLVVHDKDKNEVDLSLAQDENSFFII